MAIADRREFILGAAAALGGTLVVAGCGSSQAQSLAARFVTIRKYTAPPENVDECMRRVTESFVPIVSALPGFHAYYGVDAGGGTMLFVNIFDTQADADASTTAAAAWVPNHFADLNAVRVDKFDGQAKVVAGAQA